MSDFFLHRENYLIIMKGELRNSKLCKKSYYPSQECIKELSYLI